jgi:hypothetical protein
MSHNIESETVGRIERHKIPDDTTRLSDKIDGVPYLGSIERDMAQSNAGSLAKQDVWLLDLWQRAGGDEAEYRRLLMEEGGSEMEEAYDRSYGALKELEAFFSENDLAAVAKEIIDNKMIEEVAQGGEMERLATQMIAKDWEADEVLLTQTEIAAETGVRNPETAGIDAAILVDDEVRTLQVKMDDGGDNPDDHEADYLVRAFTETGRVEIQESD